jgi:hypothetical protein
MIRTAEVGLGLPEERFFSSQADYFCARRAQQTLQREDECQAPDRVGVNSAKRYGGWGEQKTAR